MAKRVTAAGRRRPARSSIVLRWLAAATLVLVASLYVQPLRTYLHTRRTLENRTAEVRYLRHRKSDLQRRLASSASEQTLVREARRLGLVKPGQRLYIVKGIAAWRHGRRRVG